MSVQEPQLTRRGFEIDTAKRLSVASIARLLPGFSLLPNQSVVEQVAQYAVDSYIQHLLPILVDASVVPATLHQVAPNESNEETRFIEAKAARQKDKIQNALTEEIVQKFFGLFQYVSQDTERKLLKANPFFSQGIQSFNSKLFVEELYKLAESNTELGFDDFRNYLIKRLEDEKDQTISF